MKKEVCILLLFLCIASVIAADFEGNSIFSVGNKDGDIVAFDKDGNYMNLKDTPFADWEDLTLADIDGDGVDEIIGLRDLSSAVFVYDFFNGTLVQKNNPEDISKFSDNIGWVGIRALDYDKDGKDELFLLNNKYGRFFIIDYDNGEYYTTYIGESSFSDWDGFDVAEFDGGIKIFAIRQDKNPIYIFDLINNQVSDKNSVVTGEQIGNNPLGDITVFDIDGDGEKEIIVFSSSNFFVGNLNNGFYNLKVKYETLYNDVERISHGDILNDGVERLVALRKIQFPFAYYNYVSDSLVEKTINNNKNYQWVGFGVGDIGYNSIKEETPVVEETPVEEEPIKTENKSELEEKQEIVEESNEKSNLWWIILIVLSVLIVIGIGIFFFLRYKNEEGFVGDFYEKVDDYLNKKNEKAKITSEKKEDPKKVVVKEEKEEKTTYELWPESKKSDLNDLKDIIKRRKRK